MNSLHGCPCMAFTQDLQARQPVLQRPSPSGRYFACKIPTDGIMQCNRSRRRLRVSQRHSYQWSVPAICRDSWGCKGYRHVKISQQAPVRPGLMAVQTSEVEAESSAEAVALHREQMGSVAGYGISVSDLQRFAELAPHEVFAPKTGFFVSAAHLATLLHTSLTAGVSGGPAQLAARRQALGSNSLPEREQVGLLTGRMVFPTHCRYDIISHTVSYYLKRLQNSCNRCWLPHSFHTGVQQLHTTANRYLRPAIDVLQLKSGVLHRYPSGSS